MYKLSVVNATILETNCSLSQDPELLYESEIMWTNTLFSVSTTISYIHFLYWLQLHPRIGPVVISASQVIDIFLMCWIENFSYLGEYHLKTLRIELKILGTNISDQ